jgi:hypothetical protein
MAKMRKEQKTINRVFESFCNRRIPMPKQDIIIKNAFGEKDPDAKHFYPNLDFVSAQFELNDTEIDLASTNYGNPMLSDWEKRTCWLIGSMRLMRRSTTIMSFSTARPLQRLSAKTRSRRAIAM